MIKNHHDFELDKYLAEEKNRQEQHIELIASENYVSKNVLRFQGSTLTNKYAEGYPNKRYYGGCEYVDKIEQLAIDRVCKLFNAKYANVQPHSGSNANSAVYLALLQPGDTVLGMDIKSGGHLTHGVNVNFSGRLYNCISYGVNDDGFINYDNVEKLALEHKPKMIIAGFSAYSGIVDWSRFRKIADKVEAYLMCDVAHVAGLIVTDLYPNAIEHGHVVTSTTHKTLRGARGGIILTNHKDIAKKVNSAIFPGYQGGPLMHIIGAKAISFYEALQPEFKHYQIQVLKNAKIMAEILIKRGIKIISNGTENHLVLINLIDKGITGKQLEELLGQANITVNKNTVPNDPKSPFITSGIRIGTPAITTRGFKEEESSIVANAIADIIEQKQNANLSQINQKMKELTLKFPVYNN